MLVRVFAESIVNPTEDEIKVEHALRNIFPSAKLQRNAISEGTVILKAQGEGFEFLGTLRNLIKQERIRTAARSILLGRTRGKHLRFCLNKQAAFVSRISFCEPTGESPLGPISVAIETEDPDAVIDFLAARPGQSFYPKTHRST
jgi:predicted RNA binding protein with dsRBD fold (UPF0201 family)